MKSDEDTFMNKGSLNDQGEATVQAPLSLQNTVQSRIELYKNRLTTPLLKEQLCLEIQDERWEVRSAAIKNIAKNNAHIHFYLFKQAMNDSNPFVRMAALIALVKLDSSDINHLLYVGLQDKSYQVREMTVYLFASYKDQVSTEMLERALEDEDSDVREAAKEFWHQSNNSLLPSLSNTSIKKEQKNMPLNQTMGENNKKGTVFHNFQNFSRKTQLVILAATLIVVMGTLMAASFGWWNFSFGNPDLYATVNQQQTHQGVIIKITKVYADEGRTVIAYDISSQDANKQYTLNKFDVLGSVPQKQEVLSGTYQDRPEQGIQHLYMVDAPFLVPTKVSELTLTLNIGEVLVTKTGVATTSTISGPWHFIFTIPFHHGNNKHIANPIHGDVSINQ